MLEAAQYAPQRAWLGRRLSASIVQDCVRERAVLTSRHLRSHCDLVRQSSSSTSVVVAGIENCPVARDGFDDCLPLICKCAAPGASDLVPLRGTWDPPGAGGGEGGHSK